MRTKHLIPVLATVSLLLFAGCLGGNDTNNQQNQNQVEFTQNDGLTLGLQSGSPEYFTDGGTAQFILTLHNTGGRTASNIEARIYGASWVVNNVEEGETQTVSDLTGVDRVENIPGQERTVSWTVDTSNADVPAGQTRPDTVGTEVFYDYETVGTASLTLMSADRYRDENPSASRVNTDTTGGPLGVEVAANSPIRVFEDRSVSIPVRLSNTGDGSVNGSINYQVSIGGTDLSGTGCSGSVELIAGDERQISCQYDPGTISVEETVSVRVTAEYTYEETVETQFEISGVRGG